MDEYFGKNKSYIKYMNSLIEHLESTDKTIRAWASLSYLDCISQIPTATSNKTPIQFNLWNSEWANPKDMYLAGYSIINMLNTDLYIIPGSGYDYLNKENLFSSWNAYAFCDEATRAYLPSYSPQILGASYMIWNDTAAGYTDIYSEEDIIDRFYDPIAIISDKLWRENITLEYEKLISIQSEIGLHP